MDGWLREWKDGGMISLLDLWRMIVSGRIKMDPVWGRMRLGPDLMGGPSPVSCASREKRRRTRAWRTWRKCQREPQGVFEFTMPNWPRLVLTSALWTMEWHLQPEDWSDLLSDVSNTQTLILRPPLNSHISCPSTYLIWPTTPSSSSPGGAPHSPN